MTTSTDTAPADPLALLAEAARLERVGGENLTQGNQQHRTGQQERRQAQLLTRQAVEAVRGGVSTGDRALDITLVMTGSTAKGAEYNQIVDVLAKLARHTGEPVVLVAGHGIRLGVVTDADRFGILNLAVGSHLAISATQHATVSANRYEIAGSQLGVSLDRFAHEMQLAEPGGAGLFVGTEAVSAWYHSLELAPRFNAWVVLRVLGHPMEDDAEVRAEFHRRREAMVAELLDAHNHLARLQEQLAGWRRNPLHYLEMLRNQRRQPKLTPTATGVTVDFEQQEDLQRATSDLQALVTTGRVELLMTDNPTWMRAEKALARDEPEEAPTTQAARRLHY